MILGLCGPKGSGKTTLAKQLDSPKYCFYRTPFAEPIKEMEAVLLRYQGVCEKEIQRLVWEDKEEDTEYLNHRSSRYFQATIGNEWGREIMDKDFWLGIWERSKNNYIDPYHKNYVIEDLRFLNEAELIHHYEGKIIRIERDGYFSSEHISEREYLKIQVDLIVYNNSTPRHMINQLKNGGIL